MNIPARIALAAHTTAITVWPPKSSGASRFVGFVPFILCALLGVVETAGCTPKREAAAAEIANKKSKCLFENMNRTPEEILLACAVPKDSDDWRNLYDVIVGAQVAALNAGASLPNATQAAGLAHPPAKDAGAR